jgi:hypothetical protein
VFLPKGYDRKAAPHALHDQTYTENNPPVAAFQSTINIKRYIDTYILFFLPGNCSSVQNVNQSAYSELSRR